MSKRNRDPSAEPRKTPRSSIGGDSPAKKEKSSTKKRGRDSDAGTKPAKSPKTKESPAKGLDTTGLTVEEQRKRAQEWAATVLPPPAKVKATKTPSKAAERAEAKASSGSKAKTSTGKKGKAEKKEQPSPAAAPAASSSNGSTPPISAKKERKSSKSESSSKKSTASAAAAAAPAASAAPARATTSTSSSTAVVPRKPNTLGGVIKFVIALHVVFIALYLFRLLRPSTYVFPFPLEAFVAVACFVILHWMA